MSTNTDQNTNDFMEDRTSRPGGRPNSQGMVQRLKLGIEEFNNSCSTIRMTYMLRKGQDNVWLDINLAPEPFADFINAIEDCANNREFKDYTIVERRGKEKIVHASITVKRGQDNMVALELESKGNKVELNFMPADTYTREHKGAAIPVVAQSERNARASARIYSMYLDVLRQRFKPFNNQQGNNGNRPFNGNRNFNNNNNGNYNNNNYNKPQQQQPQMQPQTTSEDDFFG